MELKSIVEKAKKGDQKSFDDLVDYYEDHFINMVVTKNNDESLKNVAKEALPELLKMYLKGDYKQPLHDYLRYYSTSYFTDKKRLFDTRNMQLDKLKNIYAKRLFLIFKKINKVLTEDELNLYTYKLISDTIDKLSVDRETLATKLGIFFAKQKRFVNTEETLLVRYILQEGYNTNIINYLESKYKFILKEYEQEVSYIYLCENFRDIIIDVLNDLKVNKTSIESTVRKKVQRVSIDYSKEISNVGLNIRIDDKRRDELYNANLVLKQRIYNLYKEKVKMPKDKMLQIIDENYDLYFNAYVNGICTKKISQYILTRFNEYFNRIKSQRQLSQEELEKKELIYLENIDCVDKKMEHINLNYPKKMVRNELISCYDNAIDMYLKKESKTDFRVIVSYKLKQKLEELNVLYSDDSITSKGLMMKTGILLNKINDNDIVDEIIDNLTKYYISNKMDNDVPYELSIIEAVENFDYDEYLKIKNIKERINLKVLNYSRK